MTNREWMESLSDTQLAQFLTDGLLICGVMDDLYVVSIQQVIHSFTQSSIGLKDWLAKETHYTIKGE